MAFEQQGLPGMGFDVVNDESFSTSEPVPAPVQDLDDPAQLEMELIGVADVGGAHD